MFNRKSLLSIVLIASMLSIYAPTPAGAKDSETEGTEHYYGFIQPDIETPELKQNNKYNILKSSNIPSSYDSRDYGYVTSVKSQGSNGTCWAFAAAATMESYAITHGYATNSTIDLSEAGIVRASYYSKDINTNITGIQNDYVDKTKSGSSAATIVNNGGNSYYTYLAINAAGLINESDWSYSSGAGCRISNYNKDKVSYILTGLKRIPASDSSGIKKAIMENGAIEASYYDNDTYRTNSDYYYNYEKNTTNHAITIVGWDDNKDKNLFTNNGHTPSGNGAWLVKNSWGTGYGTSGGYEWISYEDHGITCSYSDIDVYEIVPANTYDNIYQNDGCTITNKYVTGIANTFTVPATSEGETVSAVSFYTLNSSVNYEIELYEGTIDGTSLLTSPITGTTSYAGYYTINIPEDIIINPGEQVTAVVSFGGEVEVPVSTTDNTYYTYNDIADNESLIRKKGSTEYTAAGYNVPVKLFTENVNETGLTTPEITSIVSGGDNSITIDYRQVGSATGYYIYRSTDGSNYSNIATATTTEYTDTGLTMGKTYFYKVRAISDSKYSDYSQVKSYALDYAIPQVSVSIDKSSKQATLSWKTIASANSYNIYISNDGNKYTKLTSTTSNSYMTAYRNNVTYYYEVSAVYSNEESDKSAYALVCEKSQLNPVLKYDSMYNYTISWDEDSDADFYILYSEGYSQIIQKGTSVYKGKYTDSDIGDRENYVLFACTRYNGATYLNDGEEISVYNRYAPLTITTAKPSGSSIVIKWEKFSEGISYLTGSGFKYSVYYSNDGINYQAINYNPTTEMAYITGYDSSLEYYIYVVVDFLNDPNYGKYQVTMPQEIPAYIGKSGDMTEAVTPVVSISGATSVYKGESVELTATVVNKQAYGNYTYQWYKMAEAEDTEGTAIAGATTNTYSPDKTKAGFFYYTCKATHIYNDESKTGTGNIAEVQFKNLAVKPEVTISGPSESLAYDHAIFTANITNEQDFGTYTYQWYRNTVNSISSATELKGKNSNTLDAVETGSGQFYYFCKVTHTVDANQILSGTASTSITVYGRCLKPIIKITGDGNYTVGNTVTLTATVTNKLNYGEYTYQWYKGNEAINGGNGASYSPQNTTAGSINYKCVVTHKCGGNNNAASETSQTVTVTFKEKTPTSLTSSYVSFNQSSNSVSHINVGTKVADLINSLNEKNYAEVRYRNTKVAGDAKLCTGMSLCIVSDGVKSREYTVSVSGDTNGDGKINITDMIAIKSQILGKTKLSGGYATAGDVNGDGKINITDFIKIKSVILGKS